MIPLYTSMPPSLHRPDATGKDLGEAYQQICIESWVASGLTPISVNSRSEKTRLKKHKNVKYLYLDRDAAETSGKPKIYLADMIAAIVENSSGPVIITNADIRLELSPELQKTISVLKPGKAFFAHRTNVENMTGRDGKPLAVGIDVFVAHSADLKNIANAGFVFGDPWWDYFLPYNLKRNGVKLEFMSPTIAFHLIHKLAWNSKDYNKYGLFFANWANGYPITHKSGTYWMSQALRATDNILGTRFEYKTVKRFSKKIFSEIKSGQEN
jgi:hypothetical protein